MGRVLLVLLAALPLVLAACGGQDTGTARPSADGSPRGAPVRGRDFAVEAEAVCNGMQEDMAVISRRARPSDAEISRLLDRWRSSLDRLASMEAPPDQEAAVTRMVIHYRKMAKSLDLMLTVEDETVLAAAIGGLVEGHRGSRAARAAGLDACAFFPEIEQPKADPEPMYEAARELLPPDAEVVRGAGRDCGSAGSCGFEYEAAAGFTARLREARKRLGANGWRKIRAARTPTGSQSLMANRNDYAVTVEIIGDQPPAHCVGRRLWGCIDSVWVQRIEVPDVLSGG